MNRIHVIAVGSFGDAVAECLSESLPVAVTRPNAQNQVFPAEWPRAAVHVLAAWRPVPHISKTLDSVSFQWHVPWLPVVCEHPYLRIGPIVLPGRGACCTCFDQRVQQHLHKPEITRTIQSHYDAHPESGPGGHIRAVALFAAASAQEIIERMHVKPEAEAGNVYQIDLVNLRTAKGHAVGLHGCPRCGLQRDERTRSFVTLQAHLERLPLRCGKG